MPRGRKKKEGQVLDIQIHEDVWAMCDACQKWRRLPPGTVLDESQPWYCTQNPDKKYNSCSLDEEDWQNSGDQEISAALGSEIKAEAAKLALKKAAGHDLSMGTGAVRGRKRQTDSDTSWGVVPKKVKGLGTRISANNGGTWEPTRPSGHMSQDHINVPQWFWVGMQHLVPQAAALAANAVEVLTALQYSTGGGQQTAAAATSTLQAELYVRLSLMSAASMLQPVVKLAMQGGDLPAAAVATAPRPAPQQQQAQPLQASTPAPAPAPVHIPLRTQSPLPASSPFPSLAATLLPAAAHSPTAPVVTPGEPINAALQQTTHPLQPLPLPSPAPAAPAGAIPTSPSAPVAVGPAPPPQSATPTATPSASQSPTAGTSAAATSGPTAAVGTTAAGGCGGSSQRPGGSAGGSLSRASSPGTTSTTPTDTGPGSNGRGESRERRESREPREPRELREARVPRERQRDPAYERHLQSQAAQQPQPPPPSHHLGRVGSDRERERDKGPDQPRDRDRDRERRDGSYIREREYHREYSRERDGASYPPHPISNHPHSHYRDSRERERYPGPESPRQPPHHGHGPDGGGREWHDGRGERRDSRERERSFERQGPPSQTYGYVGYGSGSGTGHREGPYAHQGFGGRDYRGDRDRDYYGHEGPSRGGDRDGYYRGGSGSTHYGGFPPESHRGDKDRVRGGGGGGPQDWSGRERDWDFVYDGGSAYGGGHYEGSGGGSYGSGRPAGTQATTTAAGTSAVRGSGPRPVPLPPSLASLPPETVAKLLQDQGHTVKSVHVVKPSSHGQPPPTPSQSPQPGVGTSAGAISNLPSGIAPPVTVAQIRAAAMAAAQQKVQQGYVHGSESGNRSTGGQR
ncbi:hypothetical protein VOLCADRAFT_105221 [Volvox carteri f. nagariensis]|uniref:CW-type domain-containing protein n=1 Tax=Volvox carteri f. nagariensis TaxID=3068 RepID=D8TZE2_VOLCA|nr:uncharacterized protein VOLCADRAFT_105221 [Volvox carteri f. nagariensis]EFJ47166.1 hypothetical protein VOLCADRAFT_105221 [Volvox carteri f. nagariensis]|eukprot:XP_002951715.1 hypothetical protein VOLCADRAFT_105221 [Volvox carteri f. nagariensis]